MINFAIIFFVLTGISRGSVEVYRIAGGETIEIHFPAGTKNATTLPQKCVWEFMPGDEYYSIGAKDMNCVTTFGDSRHIRVQSDVGVTDFVGYSILRSTVIAAAITVQESSSADPEFLRVRKFTFAPNRVFEITTESQHPLLSLAAQVPRPAWVMSSIPGDTHITQSWLFSPKSSLGMFNFSAHIGHRDLAVTTGFLYDFMGSNMDRPARASRGDNNEKRDTFSVSCDATDPTNCTLVISDDVCADGDCNTVTSESTWFWVAFTIFFLLFLIFGLWWAFYGDTAHYEGLGKVVVVDAQTYPGEQKQQTLYVENVPVVPASVSSKYNNSAKSLSSAVLIRQPRYRIISTIKRR